MGYLVTVVGSRGKQPFRDGTFDVATAWEGDTARIAAAGELDAFTAPVLRTELEAVEATEPKRVVLDLRAVQFLDSSGLAVILGARERAAEAASWELELMIAGSHAVEETFAAIGADSLLGLVSDSAAAQVNRGEVGPVASAQAG